METILNLLPLSSAQQDAFRAAAPGAEHIFAPSASLRHSSDAATAEQLAAATVILGCPSGAALSRAGNLKWLHTWSAGVDPYLRPGVLPAGAALTCSAGAYGPAVSEHMLAMLLALMKRLPQYRDWQNERIFTDLGAVKTLAGATVLVGGCGDIGSHFALLCKALGAGHVVGLRRDPAKPAAGFDEVRPLADLDALLPLADVVALALHPQGIVDFLARYRDAFKPGALVWDVCGVKTAILEAAQVLPGTVDFIGCHPMAGTEFSGVEHAFAEMFRDSHFLLVPRDDSRPEHIALLERLAAYIGCKDVCRTTAQAHDALIAYTSQMMHLIAVSVCDDPELFQCRGFEGSSFRGCTRVAALDVGLWTQLFSLNQPALLAAVDRLLDNLQSYRDALASGNRAALAEKLAHSAARKREMDLPGPDLLA